MSGGNGDSARAWDTACNAGLGVRSRVVNPNDQSSTRNLPRIRRVGQRMPDTPREPHRKGAWDLPRKHRGLLFLAVSKAIQSDLAEQDRAIIAQAVQSCEVVLEGPSGFQVHVE